MSSTVPMPKINYVCILGGTDLGKDDEFRSAANNLGVTLAARKLHLVYGGGVGGLQGRVAAAAIAGGSRVLSFALKKDNDLSLTIGTEFKFSTMQERMTRMLLNSDAFIALPGGFLSLQEVMSILFWADENCHRKPLGFLNINGFFDGFISYINHAVEQGFISEGTRGIIVSAPTAEEVLDQLQPAPVKLDQANQYIVSNGEPDTILRL